MAMSPEKSHCGKLFRNRDVHFEIRLGIFWIDPAQNKIFRPKNLTWQFLTYDSIFRKNGYVPREKSTWEFFEFQILISKYILDHTESILTKKYFRSKRFFVLSSTKNGPKQRFVKIFGQKFFSPKINFVISFRAFIAVLLSNHAYVYLM